MRNSQFLIAVVLALMPFTLLSQKASQPETDITGLWKGTIYNDTTQKYYRYEIGISEEKGKLSGFSHTFFLVDDKEFYGVKKLKIHKQDGKIIIEDDGLIANNYPEKPPKGVRQINVLTLEIKDSIMTLSGPYSTTRTKLYSSLTGTVSLQRKNNFRQSALVPHLQELGRDKELSFVRKEEEQAKIKKDLAVQNTEVKRTSLKVEEKLTHKEPVKPEAAKNEKPGKEVKKGEAIVKNTETKPANKPTTETEPVVAAVVKPAVVIAPAADVEKRTNIVQQTVYFSSDSLELALFDNGEVDGDTVSVLMNGKIIMAKEGLSTNAVRKNIYAKDLDSIELVMYAENLGSISPNTGLLVVHDGRSIYEIRFSGDLQKNASIILRRRKN